MKAICKEWCIRPLTRIWLLALLVGRVVEFVMLAGRGIRLSINSSINANGSVSARRSHWLYSLANATIHLILIRMVRCLVQIRFPLASIGLAVEGETMPMIKFIMG